MASASSSGEVEVDVAEWFQAVTEEAITRATFGRSYDDGRVVFAMQGRLMAYASEAFRKVLVPGYRCVSFLRCFENSAETTRGCLQVLAHQEELAVVEAGQGDTAEPDPSHRPAQRRGRGRGGGDGQPLRRVPRPSRRHDQCRREEDAAGGGDPGGGHAGGMQDVLLRREADDDEPPGLGHRAPGHAPGVAGTRTPRGPRRLGPRRAPLQGAPSKAQDGGHDHKRDPAAVPAGGGHHPARQDGRAALQRVPDPARHGAADPDHGDPPRRQALGRRRGAVQPRAVRRRRGEGGEAPAGVHPVRAWRPGVHRPEPGAPGGPAHRGGPASAVRDQGVPELRPRAHGPDAPLPAVRRAGDLPATTSRAPGSRIIAQILRLSGCPTFFLSKLTGMPRVCHLPPGSGGPVQNDRNTPPATLCPCVY
ncbi:Cytochrome P450 734A1 [Zea mays]|uniref:Cytochrome P450 734A1 n=1 Tax=Zea mays TaxID=4577 RepID=A0A1D6QQY8_MAIZE|nr:Cytochrome P450 734A1 [Zea mays]